MSRKSDQASTQDVKLERMIHLLEQLVAIQLYRGGAKQQEIADNMGFSIGKANSLVKGLKPRKDDHGKQKKEK